MLELVSVLASTVVEILGALRRFLGVRVAGARVLAYPQYTVGSLNILS